MKSTQTIVIGAITLVVAAGLIAYFFNTSQMPESESSEILDTTTETPDTDETSLPVEETVLLRTATLTDVTATEPAEQLLGIETGGNASGELTLAKEGEEYVLSASFMNLPDPLEDTFYEGWLVDSEPFSFISTGPVLKTDESYQNILISTKDLTVYDTYVLTIEPNDGDPAPAGHIVEGTLELVEEQSMPSASNEPGMFIEYAETSLTEGTNLIFFAADWCPTCQTLKRDINANLGNIPANVTILEADYDSETDLRREYGVTLQHTLVEVDSEGNLIQKWTGGNTLDALLERV